MTHIETPITFYSFDSIQEFLLSLLESRNLLYHIRFLHAPVEVLTILRYGVRRKRLHSVIVGNAAQS